MHCWRPLTCHFSQACLFYCWSTFFHARPAWPPSTEGWCTLHKMSIPSDTPLSHHQIEGNIPEKKKQKLNFFFFKSTDYRYLPFPISHNSLTVHKVWNSPELGRCVHIRVFVQSIGDQLFFSYGHFIYGQFLYVTKFILTKFIWSIFIQYKIYT